MDPNATLAELRRMLADYMEASEQATNQGDLNDEAARRVAELFGALDGWLSAGGFLPNAWRQGRQ